MHHQNLLYPGACLKNALMPGTLKFLKIHSIKASLSFTCVLSYLLIFPVQVKINALIFYSAAYHVLYKNKYYLLSAHISYNLLTFYRQKSENIIYMKEDFFFSLKAASSTACIHSLEGTRLRYGYVSVFLS